MASSYAATYAQMEERSGGLLARRRRRRSTGSRRRRDAFRRERRRLWPLVRRTARPTPATIALDRHVRGRPRRAGARLIYDSPVTGQGQTVHLCARCWRRCRRLPRCCATSASTKGDRVIIYMPMVPEAVFAMLACARIGAVHSVVFGGFAANELATRIDDCRAKLIVSASCGIEPGRVVAYKPLLDAGDRARRVTSRTHCLDPAAAGAGGRADRRPRRRFRRLPSCARRLRAPMVPCVPVQRDGSALHSLHVGHDRPAEGRACATMAATWSRSPGRCSISTASKPGEVFWAASDIGWVVGHSYIVYAPLLIGCDDGAVSRASRSARRTPAPSGGSIAEHGVGALFTAPTAFRAIRQEDPRGRFIVETTISSSLRACSWRASGRIRRR